MTTVRTGERKFLCDASNSPLTITLLSPRCALKDREIYFKKTDSSKNPVNIRSKGKKKFFISKPFGSLTLRSNGKEWYII